MVYVAINRSYPSDLNCHQPRLHLLHRSEYFYQKNKFANIDRLINCSSDRPVVFCSQESLNLTRIYLRVDGVGPAWSIDVIIEFPFLL